MLDTEPLLQHTDFPALTRSQLQTLQVNLGYLCNLSCTHCHVNAGPKRTELMDMATIKLVLSVIEKYQIKLLDVTGGAPEMNPHFQFLVREARRLGADVIDRCNLTVLLEPGYESTAEFLAEQGVIVTASLPCYSEENVAEQRGKGVFEKSIEALQLLNRLGYGVNSKLPLHLVYNPNGTFLPPSQAELELDYKRELKQNHGIDFNTLLTITNMPISRFGGMLLAKDLYSSYMQLLKNSFSADNLAQVMCKTLVSVDWRGYLYDCDFNQMLNWPIYKASPHFIQTDKIGSDNFSTGKNRMHLADLLNAEQLPTNIKVGEHCYGCTAGQGSSCGGALN